MELAIEDAKQRKEEKLADAFRVARQKASFDLDKKLRQRRTVIDKINYRSIVVQKAATEPLQVLQASNNLYTDKSSCNLLIDTETPKTKPMDSFEKWDDSLMVTSGSVKLSKPKNSKQTSERRIN